MEKSAGLFLFAAILLALAFALIAFPGKAAAAATTTLQNLQAAYNGESNAHVRYAAFADRADKEGYGEVASLFRAAAKAEEVHAANHAVVIKKLGGTPESKIETPVVKSTEENLQAAIKGESYERDTMYPEFLKQARVEGDRDALQTFNYAKTAESEHAKLYSEALRNLTTLKGSKSKEYFVCTICGYTTQKMDFSKCPSCFNHKDKYEKVS
ncbi:MAG TPA: ferritin family protein [Candidatus Sulfotelmatobacter sp.]|nr:ferritin family protein [Candidatus Sulfotelmatobacter sp.]